MKASAVPFASFPMERIMWLHSPGSNSWPKVFRIAGFSLTVQFLMLMLIAVAIVGKPIERERRSEAKFWDYDDSQKYLMQFGYLEKSNIETGNLRTIEELEQAVRSLQRFGGLKETGTVDEETLALMQRPRCGAPDDKDSLDFRPSYEVRLKRSRSRRYVIQGQKWQNPIVTYSLVNQTMSELDAGQVRRILHEALGLWAQHANINFREVYSTDADIQVMFARKFHGDGYNFDGPGKILAHAFYPGTGIGGDAHFDADEKWLLNEPLDAEGTRLFDVAVHEFGHSLGLGHSSQQDAIMFPWHHISYRGKDTIPEDDRLGIQSIYGPRKKIYGKNPERHTPSTTTTTTTTTPAPPPRPTTRPYYPVKNTTGHPWEGLYPHGRPYTTRRTTTTTTERSHHREDEETRYRTQHPATTETTTVRHRPHHRPHHRTTTTTAMTTTTTTTTRRPYRHRTTIYPNPCNTSFDAITLIRNELFIFKDRWLWRMNENDLHRPTPFEIHRMFFGLPADFERIDTVYENKHQKIIFFIGKQYYVFNSQYLEPGYPRPLTDLGLPDSIERIDAALVWSHNNRTYLYSGRLYWKFDEDTNRVELDYPRDMSMWRGIGYNIDSAFQYRDGKTYFFKGRGYWRFNDMNMSIAHEYQKSSARRWMKCHERLLLNDLDEDIDVPPTVVHTAGVGTSRGTSLGRSDGYAPDTILLLVSCSLVAVVLSHFSKHYA
uniref:ZnMc domain-containing protein n=1 Tax=Anopheles coluzzii TaxID=1518534 RepID=A0A6E8W3I3_ANOCL